MRRFILLLATNGGLGYLPWAPGTWGTLAGIPAFALLAALPPELYLLTWTALLLLSCWVADGAGRLFGVVDDGRIVIDELVGYLVTVALLPFSWHNALAGFVFFRVFDIVKLPPARYFDQQIKNGIGVVMDDVVAGLYGALALRLWLHFFGTLG